LAQEIAVEEEMMKKQGISYKKTILPTDYLDNYRFQIEIVHESVLRKGMAGLQSRFLEKIDIISKLFPQIFVMNQREYFEEFARAYGDDPTKYTQKMDQMVAQANEEQKTAQRGQGGANNGSG